MGLLPNALPKSASHLPSTILELPAVSRAIAAGAEMASHGKVKPGNTGEDAATPKEQKKSEPENPITIAISSGIFQGPVIHFVKALKMMNDALRENYPQSKEIFRVLLTSDDLPDSLKTIISENELDDLIIPLPVSGKDLIGELQKNSTLLYLSAEKSKAEEALNNGIAAAAVFIPEKMEEVSETQLRVAFDGDAVLFSNKSELVFKNGLEAFLKHEKDNIDIPMEEGPLKGFLEVLQRLQRKLQDKRMCPIRTYLVTSRSAGCDGYRALNTLRTWDLEADEAVFLSGTKKGPTLEKIRPHIFFDDQMSHIKAALAVGTLACLVPNHA
ncbi:cytosolic 5'-nucleotidase 1A-like [Odontesthes bonariensis]|uniref:cytosolic 5'-nucleotidase 1A-like n=1 Tax=Odontesthes bonariensis TaxID=219752 RepID=UPI003F584F48